MSKIEDPPRDGLLWMILDGGEPEPAKVSSWTDSDGVKHWSADTLGSEIAYSDFDARSGGCSVSWLPLERP
jgi:hypothetical protein